MTERNRGGAGGRSAEKRLEFAEGEFNWIEIWTVRRKGRDHGAARFDRLAELWATIVRRRPGSGYAVLVYCRRASQVLLPLHPIRRSDVVPGWIELILKTLIFCLLLAIGFAILALPGYYA
jgi:hypothetical protein